MDSGLDMYESVDIVGLVTWDAQSTAIDFAGLPTKNFYHTYNQWYFAATGAQARFSTRCNHSLGSEGNLKAFALGPKAPSLYHAVLAKNNATTWRRAQYMGWDVGS